METCECDNLETFHVIWLNTTKTDSVDDTELIECQLRALINRLRIFNDIFECQRYIESITDADRIVIIVDKKASEEIISCARKWRHISAVYIYGEESAEDINHKLKFDPTAKGYFMDAGDLITQLTADYNYQARRLRSQIDEPISINIFNTDQTLGQSSTQLNGHFVFSHMLIDVLLRMPTNDADKNELIDLCEHEYEGNSTRLTALTGFKRSYSSEQALFWYTKESFLYDVLNKALRIQNIDLLFLFRFFICDIHEQLKRLQCTNKMRLYRSQLMSTEELCALKNSVGQHISMNSFLSTSTSREVALFFLGSLSASDDLQQILFEIDADPQVDGVKPFADITVQSHFPAEKEVLMMVGSIFLLESIHEESKENGGILHIIRMKLCSDDNDTTKLMYKMLKSELSIDGIGETTLLDFGKVLIDMGKFNEAEKYFHRLLRSLSNSHLDVADCYYGLGQIDTKKGEYESSLEWHQKALQIRMENLPFNHDDIASSHNCIGISFEGKREYASALNSYGKALAIWRSLDKNHPRTAWCLNNIGVNYQKQKKYIESLEYQQESLSIREKTLPANHPHIAASLHNIGDVYYSLDEYQTALEYYEQALSIFQRSRPNDHPDIAYTLGSIGLLYEGTNELDKSLDYFQKSMSVYEKIVSETHPYRMKIQQSLQRVTEKITSTDAASE